MEDINLNPGWESIYRMSYLDIQTVTPESYVEPSIETTVVDNSNPSNVNTIIKLLVIVGLIGLVYHLANYHSKLHNSKESKKQS